MEKGSAFLFVKFYCIAANVEVGYFLCIYIINFNKLGKKQVYICNY